jgi:hypothetical protein
MSFSLSDNLITLDEKYKDVTSYAMFPTHILQSLSLPKVQVFSSAVFFSTRSVNVFYIVT